VRRVLIALVTFVSVIGLLRAAPSMSQQFLSGTTTSSAPRAAAVNAGALTPITSGQNPLGTTIYQEPSAKSEIGQLLNQLRDAEGDANRSQITKQLEESVANYFDEDMKARESELSKLEERVSKLRSQLDRRRRAKQEIIQLQIKVLVNEADGLGFSGRLFFEPSTGGSAMEMMNRFNKSNSSIAPAKTGVKK
jgi:succinate dehydrogenase/fumarate reductase flavoprotein subunit